MITLKKQHNITDCQLLISINKFNNVVRFAYNRRIKDKITSLSKLEKIVKLNMLNINELDASWVKCAVKKSFELQTDKKLYFGGKSNFFKRKFNKIDKLDKNLPLEMRGSSNDKGNRKAKIEGDMFIFKPSKGTKFEIKLNLSKNERKMLNIIEQESLLYKNYFNFEINEKYIWISFNEPVLNTHTFKQNRFLGIDLNPNWVAISIQDKTTELYKEIIDLRELNKQNKNKKEFELSQVSKYLVNLCKKYQIEFVCLEDLNIKSSNKGQGRKYNKLCNSDWNRNYFVNNLVKWLNINDIKHLMVNPFYTSFMGQIKNMSDYDSVAASKEVAFRGYLMISGLKVQNYVNEFLSGLVTTHWKEMLPNVNTFKDLYNYFKTKKKSKNSYRFLFNDTEKLKWSSLSLNSSKSMIDLIRF